MADDLNPSEAGHPKPSIARHAGKLLAQPRLRSVPRDWWLQFTGAFLVHGHLGARVASNGKLVLTLLIKVPVDDKPFVDGLQSMLGGNVRAENAQRSNPTLVWNLSKQARVRVVLAAIVPLVMLPTRKAQQFEVALEYFAWLDSLGSQPPDRDKAIEFRRRISALKRFGD